MCANPAPFQFTDAEFYGDFSDQDREGNFATGFLIGFLLTVAGGGIIGFCIHLARWF